MKEKKRNLKCILVSERNQSENAIVHGSPTTGHSREGKPQKSMVARVSMEDTEFMKQRDYF